MEQAHWTWIDSCVVTCSYIGGSSYICIYHVRTRCRIDRIGRITSREFGSLIYRTEIITIYIMIQDVRTLGSHLVLDVTSCAISVPCITCRKVQFGYLNKNSDEKYFVSIASNNANFYVSVSFVDEKHGENTH